jgi:phenylalanyl-tRNA synthetase beta chain
MKISVGWIREYITIAQSDEELSALLTSIGFAVDAIEEIKGEKIFEIDVTTNRPDCMNVMGIVRELSAATGAAVTPPLLTYQEGESASEDLCHVSIENTTHCPRYSGKIIQGVNVSPSPPWLEKRIRQIGLRPVNNIVDLSNYVLFELGHPIHIFDFDKIKGKTIIIRNARNKERITTIDAMERPLAEDTLVIADEQDPVAIAGVMGGLDSEVGLQTKNIFIESAYFQPRSIRMTSKKLGLSTDASFRFERGADWNMTTKAIDRVTHLIQELSGGDVSSGHIDVQKTGIPEKVISLRIRRMEQILGTPVSRERAGAILQSLEMKVKPDSREILQVSIPGFRVDCKQEIDLIEEVARFIKYDSLPCTIPYATDQKMKGKLDERETFACALLVSSGYFEAINYAMISEKEHRQFAFSKNSMALNIDNPLSELGAVLRNSLLPGLLNNLSFNYSRGTKDIKLFEIGKVYAKSSEHSSSESKHLAFIATGVEGQLHWNRSRRMVDFWDIKGTAEAILKTMGSPSSFSKPLLDEPFFLIEQSFQVPSPDGKLGRWRTDSSRNHTWIKNVSTDLCCRNRHGRTAAS